MKNKILYQTLQNRDNADAVEVHGPYDCNAKSAWLGPGFYFWDTFIENAHWWGVSKYEGEYFICRADCEYDTAKCFDLHGNTEHLLEFAKYFDILKKNGLANNDTTPSRVLAFIRAKVPEFAYEAIRAYGINSVSEVKEESKPFSYRLKFVFGQAQYLDFKPAIQICLFKSTSLNLANFKIVYPEEYTDGDID